MKTAITIAILLVVLAGGGYYYWEIYRVPKVAVDLILIYERDFGQEAMQRADVKLTDSDDYAPILKEIGVLRGDLKRINEKFSWIWPPSKLKQVHSAMLEAVRTTDSFVAKDEVKARFMSDLSDLMRTVLPKDRDKKLEPDATIADLTNFWIDAIPQMKSRGDTLFAREPIQLKGVTFEELKLRWNEARDNFDVLFVLARLQNPKLLARDFSQTYQTKLTDRERTAVKKSLAFFDIIEKAIFQNSAYDIFENDPYVDEELRKKKVNVQRAVRIFSEENPDLVKKIEAEAQKRGIKL
ncbi:MAG: hypothetical protein Q8R36_00780 [bacterium]|nr:hypothetical protein [bacterium]